MSTSNQGSLSALQNRLRGVGRRTTAPVRPYSDRLEIIKLEHDVTKHNYIPSIVQQSDKTQDDDFDEPVSSRSRASSSASRIQSAQRQSLNTNTSIPSHSVSHHRRMNTFLVAQRVDDDIRRDDTTNATSIPSSPSFSASPGQLLHQGWLTKCNRMFGRRLRLFQLYTDALIYCEKPDIRSRRIALESIQLCGKHKSEGNRFEIDVIEEAEIKNIQLEADSASECDHWVIAINQARAQANSALKSRRTSPSPSVDRRASHSRYKSPWSNELSLPATSNSPNHSESPIGVALSVPIPDLSISVSGSCASPSRSMISCAIPPSPYASRSSFFGATSSNNWTRTRSTADSVVTMDTMMQVVHCDEETASYILKEVAEPENYYLMHVTPKCLRSLEDDQLSDECSCHQPYQRMSEIDHFLIQRQLYTGETSDSFFSISTPAFRSTDSIACLLGTHRHLPESVVKHCAMYLVLALTELHEHDLAYPALSASSIAIDGEGRAVLKNITPVCPLSLSTTHRSGCHFGVQIQLEYASPSYDDVDNVDALDHHGHLCRAQADDWWRLGVLLYEMAAGLPPLRSDLADADERRDDVMNQLENFHPLSLKFPSFVSTEFESFVRQLLMPERSLRLGCEDFMQTDSVQQNLDNFRKHDWLRGMAWGQIDKWNSSNAPGWIRKNVLDVKDPSQCVPSADIRISQSLNQSIYHSVSRRSRHSHNRSLSSSNSSLPQHQRQRSDFHMSFVRPLSKNSSLSATPHAGSMSPVIGPANSNNHPVQPRSSRSERVMGDSNLDSPLPSSSFDTFVTRKRPPVRVVRHPGKSSACRLIMTIIGARHLPSPKLDDESVFVSKIQPRSTKSKRLTWSKDKDPPLSASFTVSASQNEHNNAFIPHPVPGVFCAVKCSSFDGTESRLETTPLVIGGASVSSPLFQKEFAFDLPFDSVDHRRVNTPSAQLMIEIRHAKVGHPLLDREQNMSLGCLVGSVDIRVKSLQIEMLSHRDDIVERSSHRSSSRSDLCSIWHSVIDPQGVPVGELHVQYLCYESISSGESADSPAMFEFISDHSDRSFQSMFMVSLPRTTVADLTV